MQDNDKVAHLLMTLMRLRAGCYLIQPENGVQVRHSDVSKVVMQLMDLGGFDGFPTVWQRSIAFFVISRVCIIMTITCPPPIPFRQNI